MSYKGLQLSLDVISLNSLCWEAAGPQTSPSDPRNMLLSGVGSYGAGR